nr:MAG: hypothetical protein [Marsupenaeus japonicus endogenous nimavirus]
MTKPNKRGQEESILLCIECDPPIFNRKERLDENNIKEHILKSSICWIPRIKKRKVFVLCLCSSANTISELKRVARTVDLILLYIKQIYNLKFQKNYLFSPIGYNLLLYKSGNGKSYHNDPKKSLMDMWLSTARSETIRFFKEQNINQYISNTCFMDNNKEINKILNTCLSQVKYVSQLY